jgi:predicted amidophosphoribosyltransferase
MMYACPNCGFELEHKLNDGMISCTHCFRLIDSSDYNRLLSAGWLIRRRKQNIEQIKYQMQLSQEEADLIEAYVYDQGYSHEDMVKLLKSMGVSRAAYDTTREIQYLPRSA